MSTTKSVTPEVEAAPSRMATMFKSSIQQIFVFAALVVIYVIFMFAAPNFAQPKIALDIISSPPTSASWR